MMLTRHFDRGRHRDHKAAYFAICETRKPERLGVAFLNTSGRSSSTSFGGEASKIAKIGASAHATFGASLYKSVHFLNTFGQRRQRLRRS
jgi:hypothetical protein